MAFTMSSANALNLDQSKILSYGKVLTRKSQLLMTEENHLKTLWQTGETLWTTIFLFFLTMFLSLPSTNLDFPVSFIL